MALDSRARGPTPRLATAAPPAKMRGGVGPMFTARVGAAGPGSCASNRFIQPSGVLLRPGVPVSM
ncbi:MAG: hypothetical protein EBV28_04860 [Betaproteobacteria bacterium]|nr:hypothetical protein [Betaproteobacteria bacterium]